MSPPEVPPKLLEELATRAIELSDLAAIYGKKSKVSRDQLIEHVLREYVRSYGGLQ